MRPGGRQRSVCRRWPLASVRTLTSTKQSLGAATELARLAAEQGTAAVGLA